MNKGDNRNGSDSLNFHGRAFKTGRRRSLSGNDMPTKAISQNKILSGFKSRTARLKQFIYSDSLSIDKKHNSGISTDMMQADFDSMETSLNSNSSSNGFNAFGDNSSSFNNNNNNHNIKSRLEEEQDSSITSLNNSQSNRKWSHSRLSATSKLKHYLSEHIVKSNSCHHPEYHSNKKASHFSISLDSSSGHNIEYPDEGSTDTYLSSNHNEIDTDYDSNASKINSLPRTRPVSMQHYPSTYNNHLYHNSSHHNSHQRQSNNFKLYNHKATEVLDKIRHINIPSNYSAKLSSDNLSTSTPIKHKSTSIAGHSNPADLVELNQQHYKQSLSQPINSNNHDNFPNPEPNPIKMPKIECQSSIVFSPKLLLAKNKRQRLAHSISYDPQYRLSDVCKTPTSKKLSNRTNICPDFSPDHDKWERRISGYLQTSTPTGATLTAMNFGLKRVTESDKYLMITKSPGLATKEFLEEGIKHVDATCGLFNSLMQHSSCYDLMPDSGKIVIIDSQIRIDKAVDALEDNVVRAVPIWHNDSQDYSALLSVYDLPALLLQMYNLTLMDNNNKSDTVNKSVDQEEEEEEIKPLDFAQINVEQCLRALPNSRCSVSTNMMAHVSPETTLMSVIRFMTSLCRPLILVADINRSGNPLYLLTGLQVLRYLHMQSHYLMPTLNHVLEHVNLINSNLLPKQNLTYITNPEVDIPRTQHVISKNACITDILRAMALSHHPCALVSSTNITTDTIPDSFDIEDIITISDILHIIRLNKHHDPKLTVPEIIELRHKYVMTFRDPVAKCAITYSLQQVFDVCVRDKTSYIMINESKLLSSETLNSKLICLLSPLDILNMIMAHGGPHNSKLKHNLALEESSNVAVKSFVNSLEETVEESFQLQEVS